MLRELQTQGLKPIDAMNKASVAMNTGMGVVKNLAAKEVGFPTAESGTNIYFVDKERYPTTIVNSIRTDVSDYDDDFNKIAAGELVKLNPPKSGDRFAVDQYIPTGLTIGKYMAVGTDGKWKNATAAVQSVFTYGGIYNDAGHNLAIIQVVATAGAN